MRQLPHIHTKRCTCISSYCYSIYLWLHRSTWVPKSAHSVQTLRMQVSHYRYIHVILPLCHFPLRPNVTQFGNSTWISSHHCHSCHFHSVRFFQSGELLFVFTATVKFSCPATWFILPNLTELLCIIKLAHKLCVVYTSHTDTRAHTRTQINTLHELMEMSLLKHTHTNTHSWQ